MANLIFILDRSGSMETCRDDTIGGFNAFIDSQKQFNGTLTLIQFDHEYQSVYTNKPIGEVEPLTRETFVPRGSTALLDAVGRTLKEYQALSAPPTVIILTDGLENASNKYTKAHIKDLITERQKNGWEFVYLGANQDAFAEAGALGIPPAGTLNFDARRTPELFATLSQALSTRAETNGPLEF